jgi:hypothetical protein
MAYDSRQQYYSAKIDLKGVLKEREGLKAES